MSVAAFSAIFLMCTDFAEPVGGPAIALLPEIVLAQVDNITETNAADPDGGASADGEFLSEIAITDVGASEPKPVPPLVFPELDDGAVAEKLIASLEATTTLTAEFSQIAPSGAISDGRFFLRRPGLLRFEYDPPTPLLIVANGGVVYVRDEALETTDSYPVGRTPLKFLLEKEFDRSNADIVNVDRGVDSLAVTFAADDNSTDGEITLIASAPDLVLRQWIVRDAQGGSTVVRLDNVVAGEKLSTRLFRAPEAGGQFLKN